MQVLQCNECEHIATADDFDLGVYECSCGETFTGNSNRCPECNKFASKVSKDGCPECESGYGEPIEADQYQTCKNCGEPNPLDEGECRQCNGLLSEENMAKKLTKKQEAEAHRAQAEAKRLAEEADVVTVEWNGQSKTVTRREYNRMTNELAMLKEYAEILYLRSKDLTAEGLIVQEYSGWDVSGLTVKSTAESFFSDKYGTLRDAK